MITLSAKIRKDIKRKLGKLRGQGRLPAVLYGKRIETQHLDLDLKDFEKVYQEAAESSLISLEVVTSSHQKSGSEGKKKFLVLIHEVQLDPLTSKPIHVDFYQPALDEEIEVKIPLVFEGEAPAVKELGGTLVKNIQEVAVRALPQNLPHEIKVNIDKLKTFEDSILIKDLVLPEKVKVQKEREESVALVLAPKRIEEELEKPIGEKVEEVETLEKPEKEETEQIEEVK